MGKKIIKNFSTLCNICQEGVIGEFNTLAINYVGGNDMRFAKCPLCGSYSSEPYDRSTLYKDRNSCNYSHENRFFSFLKKKFLRFSMRGYIKEKSERILDFGCGAGYLANSLLESGFVDVTAMDVLQHRPGTLLKGVDYISYSDSIYKNYDVVISRHVFEHLENLDESLKHIIEFMGVQGRLICEVPNSESPFRGLMGRRWPGYYAPYHVYAFSVQGLSMALRRNGFEILRVSQKSSPVLGSYLIQFGVPTFFCKIMSLIFFPCQLLISIFVGRGESFIVVAKKKDI